MDIELILASAHHLAVFTLVAVFAVEFALVRPGLAAPTLKRLGRIDGAYGAAAVLVIIVGVLRLTLGDTGWDYYAGNHMFWGKMTAFLLVGLLTIPPTLAIRRWSKGLANNPTYLPPEAEITSCRRFIHLQAACLVLIPIFAAAMARGYGA